MLEGPQRDILSPLGLQTWELGEEGTYKLRQQTGQSVSWVSGGSYLCSLMMGSVPCLRVSVPLCPLDPRGEIGDAHGPWLCKLELEASNLTLENHPET